ncbi:hypothetical protein Sru01_08900 [Sphaerisporangium rufum]|uniref:non-specific serine/threonine protein kinase n=1 Tax=Sphaerisporangium rufum TaxID=1381558 RepID=A0A919QYZ4_9ACTN|nr:serine/threonine-protein kinase [Sphaerisporangium rufum]GII75908.1 hypothetical protein Sru01_08900 [Sphaerisporangium rufum]
MSDPGFSMPPLVGAQVGDYLVEAVVGRGGMATVYRARDRRLDRVVALKVLAPQLTRDQRFRERFVRESRLVASIDHPNIIPIYEAGAGGDLLFIAMRYVDGADLRTLLAEGGPMPLTRAYALFAQIAAALDAAHEHGMVHRDVKPANIMVAGGAGRDAEHVYLTDFGLTKSTFSEAGLTSHGHFMGTPRYVAPEQIRGLPVDGRSDLYAFACVVYEVLAGLPPFQRDTELALLYAHVSHDPPPLTPYRPDLPHAVNPVLARALAKSPVERFTSCGRFVAALRDAISGEDAPAGTGPSGARSPGARPGGAPAAPPGSWPPGGAAVVPEPHPGSWPPAGRGTPDGPRGSWPPAGDPAGRGGSWPPPGADPPDGPRGSWPPDPQLTTSLRVPAPRGSAGRGAGAPPAAAGRRGRRVGRPAVVAAALAAVAAVAVAAVVLWPGGGPVASKDGRYPGSTAAPVAFDHPGGWQARTHADEYAVVSPAAAEFDALFSVPIAADWTAVDALLRAQPDRATGVLIEVSDTISIADPPETLKRSLGFVLPGPADFAAAPTTATVAGRPAFRLAGVVNDPAQQGRLDLVVYVVGRGAGQPVALIVFFCAPGHWDPAVADRILTGMRFTS